MRKKETADEAEEKKGIRKGESQVKVEEAMGEQAVTGEEH